MENSNNLLGAFVQARCGRDEGDYFIISKIINDEYVQMVNGKNRTILNPKKKKLKHLIYLGICSNELKEKFTKGMNVLDSEVRNAIKHCIQN